MILAAAGGSEAELKDGPTDGISATKFGPYSDTLLLSSSWDSSVYLHDAIENRLKARWSFSSPILDCCLTSDPNVSFAGSLDNQVIQLDTSRVQSKTLGRHEGSVKCVSSCRSTGLLLSASWDKTMAAWDHRLADPRVAHLQLPGKAYSMDVSQNILILAMSDRHIWIFDTRRLDGPIQKRESSLKYQTRCVRAFPSGEGYVCTSIEGRVAVDFVDPSDEAQSQKYAFKCHRAPVSSGGGAEDGSPVELVEKVFPVNAAAFHPTYGTFATGGSDGIVNIWDRVNRKRIKQLPRYPSSISSISFNRDGQLMAIGASYGFEEGVQKGGEGYGQDKIFIRSIEDAEIRPKMTHL